jgi:hypothetical protein
MAVEISKLFAGSGQAGKAQPAAQPEKPRDIGDGDIFSAMGTVIRDGRKKEGVTKRGLAEMQHDLPPRADDMSHRG